MRKLILIGKWFKGKKSTVIDLQAYRELKRGLKKKGDRHGAISQGREKEK